MRNGDRLCRTLMRDTSLWQCCHPLRYAGLQPFGGIAGVAVATKEVIKNIRIHVTEDKRQHGLQHAVCTLLAYRIKMAQKRAYPL